MKKQSASCLILLAACLGGVAPGCGDNNSNNSRSAAESGGTGGAVGTGEGTGKGGATSSKAANGGSNATSSKSANSSGGSPNTNGDSSGGAGGTSSEVSTSGSSSECEIASLAVFSRSDTDKCWDNDDFSDVTLDGTCPKLANVTWPHEEGWENADPAEANREPVRFTLDSFYSTDLTGKQLNLTIELTADQRGPNATAGGYFVSLVSVSSYSRVVGTGKPEPMEPNCAIGGAAGSAGLGLGSAGSSGAGQGGSKSGSGGTNAASGASGATGRGGSGTTGSGGASGGTGTGSGGTGSGSGGASDSGGSGSDSGGAAEAGGSSGEAPITETGYTEAVSPVTEGATLRRVGDRATLVFVLPSKTAEEGSYDPTRVIKINVRIQTVFSSGETPARVYDYVSSQFAITKFTVTDAAP